MYAVQEPLLLPVVEVDGVAEALDLVVLALLEVGEEATVEIICLDFLLES